MSDDKKIVLTLKYNDKKMIYSVNKHLISTNLIKMSQKHSKNTYFFKKKICW